MEYKLTFNEQQMQMLQAAIGELPFKHAAPLVQAINQQVGEQMPKGPPPKE